MLVPVELEELLASDPYDEATWRVVEDWVLAHDPELEPLVALHHRPGVTADELRALRRRLAPRLLGPVEDDLGGIDPWRWRGPFAIEGFAHVTPFDEPSLALLRAPAARVLRDLELGFDRGWARASVLERVVEAPCARSLRRLAVRLLGRPPRHGCELDVAVLASTRIEQLFVERVHYRLRSVERVPTLRRLDVPIASERELEHLLSVALPGLRHLALGLRWLRRPRGAPHVMSLLTPLFACRFAPNLERLRLPCRGPDNATHVLRAVRESSLLPRLRALDLGGATVDPASVPGFAHLTELRLAAAA